MENITEDLKQVVNKYVSLVVNLGIIIIILATFFLFTNLTTEIFDTGKFMVVLAITLIMFVVLTVNFTLSNKVTLTRTPLDLPLLLLLAVGAFSTVFSASPYVSLLGNVSKIQSSFVFLAVYIILYFTLVNSIKSKDVKWILFLLTWGGVVLSILSLLSYWGIKLLPNFFVQGLNFTPTGSSFSTAGILAFLVPILTVKILTGNSTAKLLNLCLLTLFGLTIVLIGNPAAWVAAAVGFVLPVAMNAPKSLNQIKPMVVIGLAIPLVVVVLVTLLSFIPPVGGAKNPLYDKAKNFPREVALSFKDSWKISVSAFRDAPFLGTGPGTYLFDFTKYKPLEMNSGKFWNLRFDSAFNEYLQILATLGGVGIIAILSLTILFISSAYSSFFNSNSETTTILKQGLAVSGLIFFIILALHVAGLVVWVIGIILLACFMVLNQSDERTSLSAAPTSIKQVVLGLTGKSLAKSNSQTIRVEALPSVLLTIAIGLLLFVLFFAGKYALADYHHRLALNAASSNQGIVAYNELIAAEKLNPQNDLYRTDLAQVNFALANAIALAKGPTEASPGGSLTDQDKQNIQVLLQQSINEGRTAVTLSPNSAVDWEILALLYRQISGVAQNALVFSLDSYGRAIFQDPLNPLLRLSVGGTYYAIRNYDLAIRFFTDSINLKPDFANGYYNLSVALRDKGDLNTAQVAAEKVLTLVDANSQDYKVAKAYLDDLKNRIASGSAQNSEIKPPASETTGALQKKELPKVVNVGTPPEKIATPPAIPKPSPTPTP